MSSRVTHPATMFTGLAVYWRSLEVPPEVGKGVGVPYGATTSPPGTITRNAAPDESHQYEVVNR
jgi:hypothetical protein